MLKNISSSNDLNSFKGNRGTWLVLYHADWCYHCNEFMPTWEQACKKLKTKNVNTIAIESEQLNEVNPHEPILGFPTIHLVKNGKLKKVYNEPDRELKTVLRFVDKNHKKVSKKKKPLKKKKSLKKKKEVGKK
jgi:thiol-disulfide isomerase/thioredoxin